jgi:hypothetical protein
MTYSSKRTILAIAVTSGLAGVPSAYADVINLSWHGAFTWLSTAGEPLTNSITDYQSGYYGNGAAGFGAPYFAGNVSPDADCTTNAPACVTTHGWYGNRTPVSGTLKFDTATGAGIGTMNPFFFLGDKPGSGVGTSVFDAGDLTFVTVDTMGTLIGTMQFSWNAGTHSLSIALDASGLFASLAGLVAGGATSTVSGVGALPATDGLDFNPASAVTTYPLGPSPAAMKTLDVLGCEGVPIAELANPNSIVVLPAFSTCDYTSSDDGIGGSPAQSIAFDDFNFNFDITSVHFDSVEPPQFVPVPAAAWLFGTGLAGLLALGRRKRRL